MKIQSLFVTLTALALLATSVSTQTASYSYFGSACSGGRLIAANGPVPFAVSGVPRLGGSFTVTTESSDSYPWGHRRQVFLFTGVSNAVAQGVPLPFDISVVNPTSPWCGKLLVSTEIVVRAPSSGNYQTPATIKIQVPNVPAMAGVAFYQQVMVLEFSSFGPPFSAAGLSRAGSGIIGF